VDGTFLRGGYKGKLLIAVAKSSNNNILPIAFAVVDEETTHSWKWFLKYLIVRVLDDRQTCIISDRHSGILSAMETIEEKYPGTFRLNFTNTLKRMSCINLFIIIDLQEGLFIGTAWNTSRLTQPLVGKERV